MSLLNAKYATNAAEGHAGWLAQAAATPTRGVAGAGLVGGRQSIPLVPAPRSGYWEVPASEMDGMVNSALARALASGDASDLGLPEGSLSGGGGEGGPAPSDSDAAAQSRAEALPMPPRSQLLEMGVQVLDPAAQALQANLLALRNGHERWLNERAWAWEAMGGRSFDQSTNALAARCVGLGLLPVLSRHILSWRRECFLVSRVWKLGHPASAEGDVAPLVEATYAARNPSSTINTHMEIRAPDRAEAEARLAAAEARRQARRRARKMQQQQQHAAALLQQQMQEAALAGQQGQGQGGVTYTTGGVATATAGGSGSVSVALAAVTVTHAMAHADAHPHPHPHGRDASHDHHADGDGDDSLHVDGFDGAHAHAGGYDDDEEDEEEDGEGTDGDGGSYESFDHHGHLEEAE